MNENQDETPCPSNKEDYHLPLDENPYIRHSTTPCNTEVDLDETPYLPERNPQIGITPIATQTVDPTVVLLLHQMQLQQQDSQIQLTRALEHPSYHCYQPTSTSPPPP